MADPSPARVLLVTSSALVGGEPGGSHLSEALAGRGISAAWVRWDDPAVDWNSADLIAVRSTWDYTERYSEFLTWARSVPRLMNGAGLFAWNTDKRYLADLARTGLPVVPTLAATDREELAAALRRTLARAARAVLKPAVGAGGDGVRVLSSPADAARLDVDGPMVIQPLLESVRTFGELSVFVLGGRAGLAVRKRPATGEIRVHEEFGGVTERIDATARVRALAERVVATAEQVVGADIDYARVDLMQDDGGELVLSELEVTEPGLYLDVLPDNAHHFAELVRRVLDR